MGKIAESIIYDPVKNTLSILNQLLLPLSVVYEDIKNVQDGWNAIKQMKIRGAPAIAMLGLMSVAVELGYETVIQSLCSYDLLFEFLKQKADYLCSSRPTAVNIRKEFDNLLDAVKKFDSGDFDSKVSIKFVRDYCFNLLEIDRQTNKKIGDYGATHIQNTSSSDKLSILTHCNTGSLATVGYGTALGVIRSIHQNGLIEQVYCTETRPYNQGSRLTAWELLTEEIPSTLICDNMVALLMSTRKIDAVVVGADRVAANGDTANKIGTFQIALLCKSFNVPFYVASPLSTIDFSISDGSKIPIEERSSMEMKFVGNVQIAPTDMKCWNPAFDVTQHDYITGIITEFGVVEPKDLISRFNK